MNTYRADLHIHTILSPCGDLQMSPANIVRQACAKQLDIIAITDHNTTRQAPLIQKLAAETGLFVLCGAEVTSKEEAHCLTYFPDLNTLNLFQVYLDQHLPEIKNDTNSFGYQVCVDENEDIVFEEERLLISGINQSIEQIEQKVHELNGIFIPAHINRSMFSVVSQLGFVPPDLNYDALELSRHTTIEEYKKNNSYLKNAVFIQNSDSHMVETIGSVYSNFTMQTRSFDEIKKALYNIDGRSVNER